MSQPYDIDQENIGAFFGSIHEALNDFGKSIQVNVVQNIRPDDPLTFDQTLRSLNQRHPGLIDHGKLEKIESGDIDIQLMVKVLEVYRSEYGADMNDIHEVRSFRNSHAHFKANPKTGAPETLEKERIKNFFGSLDRLYTSIGDIDGKGKLYKLNEYVAQGCPRDVQVVEKEIPREVEVVVEKPVYVDRVVEKRVEVPVVKIKEVPVQTGKPVCMELPSSSDDPGFEFTDGQKKALGSFESWWLSSEGSERPFIVAGVAGSGKSTLINEIIRRVMEGVGGDTPLSKDEVLLLTPTGKAKQELKKKMKYGLKGRVQTLSSHVWCWVAGDFDGEDLEFEKVGPLVHDPVLISEHNGGHTIECHRTNLILKRWRSKWDAIRFVVVDEASMITRREFDILNSNPQIRFVFVGDPEQLPPVISPGDEFDEPADILKDHDCWLENSKRQSPDSSILEFARKIRFEEPVAYGQWSDGRLTYMSDSDGHYDREDLLRLIDEHEVVLVARNRSRLMLNDLIRTRRGYKKNPTDFIPKPGEKLVCIENNKQAFNDTSVTNGEILELVEFQRRVRIRSDAMPDFSAVQGGDPDLPTIPPADYLVTLCRTGDPDKDVEHVGDMYLSSQILMNEHLVGSTTYTRNCTGPRTQAALSEAKSDHSKPVVRCEWGYVLTVHKAQGSQWDSVLVLCDGPSDRGLSDRCWRYVAATRAINRLTMLDIGPETIRRACSAVS